MTASAFARVSSWISDLTPHDPQVFAPIPSLIQVTHALFSLPIYLPESVSNSTRSQLSFFLLEFDGHNYSYAHSNLNHLLLISSLQSFSFDFTPPLFEPMARLHCVLFISVLFYVIPALDASAGDVDPVYKYAFSFLFSFMRFLRSNRYSINFLNRLELSDLL